MEGKEETIIEEMKFGLPVRVLAHAVNMEKKGDIYFKQERQCLHTKHVQAIT